MTLVLQIVMAVVVLMGLITVIMSIKNWHWAQMLLLLAIFFSSLGTLFLGMEVFRIHRSLRKDLPARKQQLADLMATNDALVNGSTDPTQIGRIVSGLSDPATLAGKVEPLAESLPGTLTALDAVTEPADAETVSKLRAMFQEAFGTSDVAQRQALLRSWAASLNDLGRNERLLKIVTDDLNKYAENASEMGPLPSLQRWRREVVDFNRQRGRAWRSVVPAGPIDPKTGRIPVTIAQPKPHGLDKDAIVFAFEQGAANAADPNQGAQFLGEFRVVDVNPDGAILESVIQLDNRTGGRIVQSQQSGPQGRRWTLYESIPADRHDLFAGLSEADLKRRLPAASVEEYLRHGQKGKKEDFDEHARASFDDQGRRLGPEDESKAVEWRYDRQLRDYAYLFAEAARQRVVALAEKSALVEDISKLKTADQLAKQLGAQRTEEKGGLTGDLEHMKADRQAIESLLATVKLQLTNAQQMLTALLAENMQRAEDLTRLQLGRYDDLDVVAPAAPAPPFAAGP